MKQALAGIKVVDFGQMIAGTLVTRHLANHGAIVIRIETATSRKQAQAPKPEDLSNYTNAAYNCSKYSMALNLKHPEARPVMEKLICWADVVNENFRPGTMEKLGLSYNQLCRINPGIIMLSSSGYGQTGPLSQVGGNDGRANAASGRTYLSGWPDRGASTPTSVPFPDAVHPLLTAMAIVAALDYRRRTGKGQHIDASMAEVISHQVMPAMLDWQINKHLQQRSGNRIPEAAPHGVFPCADDRLCAIAVFSQEEWISFCNVIGNPSLAEDPKFATLEMRKQNEDALENTVAGWTVRHSAQEVMTLLQNAGIAAGVVQNAIDLVEHDPQLEERQFLITRTHKSLGTFGHPAPAYKLLRTMAEVNPAPLPGEHTRYVCKEILGMSDDEFTRLSNEKVFE